ncbi:MAG: NYN domain-containing protein [Clostridiales bacterium]|jgi:predicted RNA-binding protein with PIN domain|nr:NYN domain-containing protein [Clostridiales bacterium]
MSESGARPRNSQGEEFASPATPEYVLVDGYNVINCWSGTVFNMAKDSLEDMRDKLISMLADYQGYTGSAVILVFDAHYVKRNRGSELNYGKLRVVFTKENYSADNYIERFVYVNAPYSTVKVVTGDYLEQRLVLYGGGLRMSPDELLADIKRAKASLKDYVRRQPGYSAKKGINDVSSHLGKELADLFEEMRHSD